MFRRAKGFGGGSISADLVGLATRDVGVITDGPASESETDPRQTCRSSDPAEVAVAIGSALNWASWRCKSCKYRSGTETWASSTAKAHLSRRRVHRSQGRVPEHRTLAVRHCLQLRKNALVPVSYTFDIC